MFCECRLYAIQCIRITLWENLNLRLHTEMFDEGGAEKAPLQKKFEQIKIR